MNLPMNRPLNRLCEYRKYLDDAFDGMEVYECQKEGDCDNKFFVDFGNEKFYLCKKETPLSICSQKPSRLGTVLLLLSLVLLFTLSPTPQGFCFSGKGEEIISDTQIVNAIYKAENSKKYPYGIKSIDTKGNEEYARKICFNSVRNGRKRWIEAGKPDDLITFIGKRYSPPEQNPYWVKNVNYFLEKK